MGSQAPGASEPTAPVAASAPCRAGNVFERPIESALVLWRAEREQLHFLNQTAALAWNLCDGSHDLAAIVEALTERYPSSRRLIEADLPALLDRLWEAGLLARG